MPVRIDSIESVLLGWLLSEVLEKLFERFESEFNPSATVEGKLFVPRIPAAIFRMPEGTILRGACCAMRCASCSRKCLRFLAPHGQHSITP